MEKSFMGRIPGVRITIKFEDGDMTDADFLVLARRCQQFVDSFDSVEEFEDSLNRVAERMGKNWELIH
jgi:hypothetical protein